MGNPHICPHNLTREPIADLVVLAGPAQAQFPDLQLQAAGGRVTPDAGGQPGSTGCGQAKLCSVLQKMCPVKEKLC